MHYRLFGLHVHSAIPLPSRQNPFPEFQNAPDVIIEYGVVPNNLSAPHARGILFQSSPGEVLLRIDGVARYYVHDGQRITVMPENNAHEDDILVFLMGSAMGALLHQRRILALHAGGIVVNGKAVIFSGTSGAGKSTLTAGFYKRGYQFLADDVCAVATHKGEPAVTPGFPRLKLWADVLKNININKDELKRVRWGGELEKYFLPVDQLQDCAVTLKSVFVIGTSNKDEIEIVALKGGEKIDPLLSNIYRFRMLKGLDAKGGYFTQCAAIAAKINVYRIQRPVAKYALDELMDLIEERFLS